VVEVLLATGKVAIDVQDKYGRTALIGAAWAGHKEVVEVLLATGKVAIDIQDKDGQTALMMAAWRGHKDVVEMLQGNTPSL
jgi:ankyrin repeat protein